MADLHELDQIRGVVGRAFLADPLSAWIFPDAMTRPSSVTAFFGGLVEDGLSIGLETTNPRNHSFYRSVGFTDVETFEVADGAPPATAMRLD